MAPRRKEMPMESARIEESPLLASRPSLRSSTVDPAKLDRTRFTEIREMESDGSSFRIIIFIAVIIVLGVAAALFVRNAVMNSQNSATDNTEGTEQQPQQETNTALSVSKTPMADSSAVNIIKNADYVDSAIVNLGDSTSAKEQTSLDKLTYVRYTSFARLTFDLNTSDKKLPKTTVNFDSVANRMTVSIENLGSVAEGLKQDIDINDLITEIRYVVTDNSFVILFKDPVKYNVKKEGDNLVFNFKTNTELAKPDSATNTNDNTANDTETTTPTTNTNTNNNSSTSNADMPKAPHFDNEFSQNKQYVVSNVSTNKLAHNVYYFDNYGSSWEFSWAQKNVIGDSNVPNATAYYDTSTAGKTYLIVEIQNLTQEVLTANGVEALSLSDIEAKTGATTAGSTLVKVDLVSFENGIAKYRLELSKKSDFKLWVDKTVDNQTGTVSVTVKN